MPEFVGKNIKFLGLKQIFISMQTCVCVFANI